MRCETRWADGSFSLLSFPELLRSDYYYALPSPGAARQQTNSSKRKRFKIKCNNNKIKKDLAWRLWANKIFRHVNLEISFILSRRLVEPWLRFSPW